MPSPYISGVNITNSDIDLPDTLDELSDIEQENMHSRMRPSSPHHAPHVNGYDYTMSLYTYTYTHVGIDIHVYV